MSQPDGRQTDVHDYRIATSVLETMVRGSVTQRDRVRIPHGRRGPEVKVDDGRCRVTLPLEARFGEELHALAAEVQDTVRRGLASMTGLEVETVDIVFTGVYPHTDAE